MLVIRNKNISFNFKESDFMGLNFDMFKLTCA